MRVCLVKKFRFEAAHRLPLVATDHKCFRLHGHSYGVELVLEGEVDPKTGWLVDFDSIESVFRPVWLQLDHHYLNEIPGLDNPTSENIARWIWERIATQLPLSEIRIDETSGCACIYRGQ